MHRRRTGFSWTKIEHERMVRTAGDFVEDHLKAASKALAEDDCSTAWNMIMEAQRTVGSMKAQSHAGEGPGRQRETGQTVKAYLQNLLNLRQMAIRCSCRKG